MENLQVEQESVAEPSPRSAVDKKLLQGAGFGGVVAGRGRATRVRSMVIRRAGHGLLRDDIAGTHPAADRRAALIKRATDVTLSVTAIVVLMPLWLTLAVLVKLTSSGPILYTQYRLGQEGSWFPMFKFRSMVVDADARLRELLASDEDARREFDRYHKLANDPRVTLVGRFMRKTSLDELPQLLNILAGHMSFVGPRGYLPFEVLKMDETDRILKILSVKPGLTGFWQVGGRSNVDFDERLDMDVFYIQNWSFGMDMYLLVNTFWIVLFGRGVGAS